MKVNKEWIYFISICLSWFLLPILSIIPLIYLAFSYRFKLNKSIQNITIIIIGITYGLIGLTVRSSINNTIPTDLERYKDVYDYLVSTESIFEYISGNFIFDSINWLSAHYITTDSQFVAFIWPCISIIFLMFAIRNISYQFIDNNDDKIVIFIFATLFMIPYAILYELLKQITAYSIIVYALILSYNYLSNKRKIYLYIFIAFFIHFSSILLLFPLLLAKFDLCKKNKSIYIILSLSFLLSQVNILKLLSFFTSIPIFNILTIAERISAYSDFSDFGGSKRFYMGVLIYFCLVLLFLRDNRKKEYYPFFLFFIVLLLNFSNNHNLARLINTMYPFLIILFVITSRLLKEGLNRKIYIATFVFIIFLFNTIQYLSNIKNNYYYTFYDNNIVKLITSNCADFILYNEK